MSSALTGLIVPARFNGPPESANGGVMAGRLAAALRDLSTGASALRDPAPRDPAPRALAPGAGPVTVTLREPPPLATRLDVALDDSGRAVATFGGAVIATAEPGSFSDDPVDPVGVGTAAAAEAGYAGLRAHPFPTCFVCGPDRADGMGLRPGRAGDPDGRQGDSGGPVACTWTPDATLPADDGLVDEPIVWAALDCPSGWATDLEARPMVLGRITAAVDARPHIGDRCVVVARVLRLEGRKALTASTAYDPDGRILGRAESVWIALR